MVAPAEQTAAAPQPAEGSAGPASAPTTPQVWRLKRCRLRASLPSGHVQKDEALSCLPNIFEITSIQAVKPSSED